MSRENPFLLLMEFLLQTKTPLLLARGGTGLSIDKMGPQPFFVLGKGIPCSRAGPQVFQQPCQVFPEGAHGLQAFLVFADVVGGKAVHLVPILGTDTCMLEIVKYLFRRSNAAVAAAPAAGDDCRAQLPLHFCLRCKRTNDPKRRKAGRTAPRNTPATLQSSRRWYPGVPTIPLAASGNTHVPVFLQCIQAMQPAMGFFPRYRISEAISCRDNVSWISRRAV